MLEVVPVRQLREGQLQRGIVGLEGLDELVLHDQREGLHHFGVFGDPLQHLRLAVHLQPLDPRLDVHIVERGDLFHQDFLAPLWRQDVLPLAEGLQGPLRLLDLLAAPRRPYPAATASRSVWH